MAGCLLILATLHAAPPAPGQTPTGCLVHSPAPAQDDDLNPTNRDSVAYQQFPAGRAGEPTPALETAWFVTFDHGTSKALFITGAWFKPGPNVPFSKVLSWTGPSELYVHYQTGRAYQDLRDHTFSLSQVTGRDAGRCGAIVGRQGRVIREVSGKGVLWKNGQDVVRGQMMAIWGALDAANYNYIIRYEFHDDGTFKARLGATARNLAFGPTVAHSHVAFWRIDVDLDGAEGDSVKVLRHQRTSGDASWSDTEEAFNGETEGSLDFTATEFTRLQVADGDLVYELRPIYRGLARHSPTWTRTDFWATVADTGETHFQDLAEYAADEENISNADIVLWQASPLLHVVRSEDGGFIASRLWRGSALAMWTGFEFRPRDLFSGTPFHPGTAPSDPEVSVSFGAASYEATEGAAVTVGVNLNADPKRSLDIDLVRTHDGATDADYSGVPFNVRFDPGVTSREFTITATDDTEDEESETVMLSFAALPQGVTNAGGTTVTIQDDD